MKICVIQPPYSYNEADMEKNFQKILSLLDECDNSLDLIVLPEYSDVPADTKDNDAFYSAVRKNGPILLDAASRTARRCSAFLFVNAMHSVDGGESWRNTTHVFSREGELVGRYYKKHPAPSEVRSAEDGGHGLDVGYSYEYSEPTVIELEGMRIGFLTCYDFYFYEYFPVLAREGLDVIIGCSLQRTDTHEALSIINKFLAYNTNAYLIRASVSLSEDSPLCGTSTVVAPDGREIVNMKSRVGLGICEINVADKYYKPAGFGGVMKAHYEYIEEGRRPWLYRNGGASVVLPDSKMPYPRLCAHRGFNTVAPENSMAAFGSAVALGAEEIEFDLWATSDGVLVSSHDPTLERVSDGKGEIYEKTYAELMALDFGAKAGEKFRGMKIATFEEILKKFAARVVMNVHVKIWDMGQERDMLEQIVALIRRYDAAPYCYFMTANDDMIRRAMEYAPDIKCCVGWDGNETDMMSLVKRARELGAYKIQLFKPYFNEETVRAAHESGILCNVFYADTPEEAIAYRKMGIDTILTNDYLAIKNALTEAFDE